MQSPKTEILCKSVETRDLRRDDCIKDFIKRKLSSGLFWAVGAAEKKKPYCNKYATFWGGFFNFLWAKKHN
jgi:hypothetical protein